MKVHQNKICLTFSSNLEILNIQNSLGDSERGTDGRTRALHTVTDCPQSFRATSTLKLGHFGQQIRNTWKVLKCGAGEGWRRSVGPIT